MTGHPLQEKRGPKLWGQHPQRKGGVWVQCDCQQRYFSQLLFNTLLGV